MCDGFYPFLGYIPLGFTRATIIHIPVIIASLFDGTEKSGALGFLFGLTSFINNTMNPTPTSICIYSVLQYCFHKKLRHGMQTWNISVYNAYNAMTPNLIYKEEEYIGVEHIKPDGSHETTWKRKTKLIKQTLLPCVPSITYTYRF